MDRCFPDCKKSSNHFKSSIQTYDQTKNNIFGFNQQDLFTREKHIESPLFLDYVPVTDKTKDSVRI